MENKCPKCGDYSNYCYNDDIEQDGNILWVDHWCKCSSCGQRWKYVEEFTLKDVWIETEEKD